MTKTDELNERIAEAQREIADAQLWQSVKVTPLHSNRCNVFVASCIANRIAALQDVINACRELLVQYTPEERKPAEVTGVLYIGGKAV